MMDRLEEIRQEHKLLHPGDYGSHCAVCIAIAEVDRLRSEVERLRATHIKDVGYWMDAYEKQKEALRLVVEALEPIVAPQATTRVEIGLLHAAREALARSGVQAVTKEEA